MKIRILGGPGSGKHELATRLARVYDAPTFDLTALKWSHHQGLTRAPQSPQARDWSLQQALYLDAWVIEGSDWDEWVSQTFTQADLVIVLELGRLRGTFRLIKRHMLSKFGLVESYTSTFKELLILIRKGWHWPRKRIREHLETLHCTVQYCKTSKQVFRYLQQRQQEEDQ